MKDGPIKKDRHSANGVMGRNGLPKKGGAGGKGTWGKPGDELLDMHEVIPKDDQEELDVQEEFLGQEEEEAAEAISPYEYKASVIELLEEFFSAYDHVEALRCLNELEAPFFERIFVQKAFTMSMERNQAARENVVDLLKLYCTRDETAKAQFNQGLHRVLDKVADLSLDVPNANQLLVELVQKLGVSTDLEIAVKDFATPGPLHYFKTSAKQFIKEFLSSYDLEDFEQSLKELNRPHFHYEVPRLAISAALDRKGHAREYTSLLLSHLYHANVISSDQMAKGFERLLENTEDLTVDSPDAPNVLSLFLARAVVDEIICPSFLMRVSNLDPTDRGVDVIAKTRKILSGGHVNSRLMKIWGPHNVRRIKKNIKVMVDEYLVSEDVEEVEKCILELDSHPFHHEIVKVIVTKAIEKGDDKSLNKLSSLLKVLCDRGVVSQGQLIMGLERIQRALPDLKLDVPRAAELHSAFLKLGSGWIPPLGKTVTAGN